MIKAVIFDLNGVFLKSERLSNRVEKRYGVSGAKFWLALNKVLIETRKPGAQSFFKLLKPYFDFWFSGEKLVPEVLEYAKELRGKGRKALILSRNFKERTEYYRKNFPEIFANIDKVYFSWETGLVKPDPKAYQAILEEHGLKPEECVYFDDVDENIEVARNLGLYAQKYKDLEAAKKFLCKVETANRI